MADSTHPCSVQPGIPCAAGLFHRARGTESCQGLGGCVVFFSVVILHLSMVWVFFAELDEGNVLLSPLRKPLGYWANIRA